MSHRTASGLSHAQLVAELTLDKTMAQDVLAKNIHMTFVMGAVPKFHLAISPLIKMP